MPRTTFSLPTVLRERLFAVLDVATRAPVTLIAAGPGTGKTLLLASWVRQRRARLPVA